MTELRAGNNFLQSIISSDLAAGRVREVVTRFPPEPNGYLHIGHIKSISVNFGLAQQFGGRCHLRFDDTNPEQESQEYIESIQENVRWLGYQWDGEPRYASAYFQQLYEWAEHLVRHRVAYVCDLSPEQAREYRGTLTSAGRDSPYRERPVEENLDLLRRMRAGEFAEGSRALRAKIDMASPNMNLRDPVLYRIRKLAHHQTGTRWCIYPSYDYAHGQGDAIEGVTHSICTLEFEDHRPLYDWFLDQLPVASRPRQYEFGRLNVSYTVTSKRKLKRLVDLGVVAGWDDPRMPTVEGLRRRGYTPAALRTFCEMVGTTRSDGVVDVAMLEYAIRDHLNQHVPRAMCVLNPLRVQLVNYQGEELLTVPGHPSRDDLGERELPFTRELFIDRADFREQANKKYKRLVLGKRVRLRHAYVIEAEQALKDDSGEVVELRCRVIEDSLGKAPADGIKPRGVIHWVSASAGARAELRLYERLFNHPAPDRGEEDFTAYLNPHSLQVKTDCVIEPSLLRAEPGQSFQFEREAYFVADRHDHRPERPVFNKTIALRESMEGSRQ